MQGMDAVALSAVTEPLGMASIKKGFINNLKFNITGTDYGTHGDEQLLYKNLNVKFLKKNSDDEFKNKGILSFIANLVIKNNNPQNGVTRTGTINFKRDITKSFFNLLWQSIFVGAKDVTK